MSVYLSVCVCVCACARACACLYLFLCVPLGLPTLPHDPPPMWTGTELLSARIRQEDGRQHTAHNTFRRHGKKEADRKRHPRHHHHPSSSFHCDSEMSLCRFFPSLAYSESSPRGGCTPCLLSVPGEGTSIQHKSPRLTRLTPLPPPSVLLTVYERPRLPVWSPLSFIISSLRTLSTRYHST